MTPPYTIFIQWSETDQCYVVRIPALTRVMQPCTHGETYEAAARHAQEVIETYRTINHHQDGPLPDIATDPQAPAQHLSPEEMDPAVQPTDQAIGSVGSSSLGSEPVEMEMSFDQLVTVISHLELADKIKLRQILADQIVRSQMRPHPIPYEQRKAATEALSKTVEQVLAESGMTEDELVEALTPTTPSHLK